MKLLFGADQEVAGWVASHIPTMMGENFGPCSAIGVASETGQPIAGVVYHNHFPQYRNIELSVAAVSPKWLTRPIITSLLRYPFVQLGVRRLTVVTPADRQTSVWRFLTKFGFQREGLIRKGLGTQDAVVWGLLASEWRFNRYNLDRAVTHGKVSPSTANAPRSHRRRKRPIGGEHRLVHGAAKAEHAGGLRP